jgi:hypothetical protein
MQALIILGGLGLIGYAIFSSKSASASTAQAQAASNASLVAANQNMAAKYAFDDRANVIGLTQDQAQNAWDLGLSPDDLAARVGQ